MGPAAIAADGQKCQAWKQNIRHMIQLPTSPPSLDGDLYPGLVLYLPDDTFEDAGSECRQVSQGDWIMNYMKPVSFIQIINNTPKVS